MPRSFDTALMDPPDESGTVDEALLRLLRSWCEGGAFPVLTEPLRIASIAPHDGLDAAACELDGSHALARRGRWRGLLWRLQILWGECVTGRAARAEDPWDCGWWREDAQEAAASFQPRRATLLLVRDSDPARVAALVAALRSRSASYACPVRVLVLSAAAASACSIAAIC